MRLFDAGNGCAAVPAPTRERRKFQVHYGNTVHVYTPIDQTGGPGGDLPWYTKSVVLLTSELSVAIFAIPASMLTWGFEAKAARMAKRARMRAREQHQHSDEENNDK